MAAEPYGHCICIRDGHPHPLCWGANGFEEQGIRAQLIPNPGEQVQAMAFDGCIATDQDSQRCDGVMVLRRRGQTDLLLVELKNTRNAEHGFAQILYTAQQRSDYQVLKNHEERRAPGPLRQQGFLVTTKAITTLERSKRKQHGNRIKVTVIRVQRGSSATPNLRDYVS